MKNMDSLYKTARIVALLSLASLILAGCNTDENPVSPDKMEEIRKQEGNERANFNPSQNPKSNGN